MYFLRILVTISVLVLLISLTFGAKTTTPKTTTTKPAKPTKPTTSATTKTVQSRIDVSAQNASQKASTGPGKIITTRFGADGNPEQQCQCTLFYLCNQGDVIDLPADSGTQCEDQGVCCRIPLQSLATDEPILPNGSSSSSGSQNPTPTSNFQNPYSNPASGDVQNPSYTPQPVTDGGSNCVCVPFYQCIDYDPLVATAGAGIINPRIPCQSPDVCCPIDHVTEGYVPTGSQSPVTNDPFTPTPSQPPYNPPTPNPPTNSEECGIRRGQVLDTRIVSPETLMQTNFGEFPWMALILTTEIAPNGTRTENVFVCGASLLSPLILLTAAHCVNEVNISLLKVRVGEYNTHRGSAEPQPHQDRSVASIHVHPNFNSRVLFNDLALISVTEEFQLASHVQPICAPFTNTPYVGSDAYNPSLCLATGWGKNAFKEGNFQTTLRKVDLSIIPREDCQARLRETRLGQYFILDPSFMCAGGQPGFDTCQGDGGGPLICASRDNLNRYIQVGIVSWGIGCASNVPGVYASLEANREWLTTEFNTMTVFRRG